MLTDVKKISQLRNIKANVKKEITLNKGGKKCNGIVNMR